MSFLDFISVLEDPTAIIVSAAIVVLTISTIKDRRQHRRQASRHREHLLTDTVLHFRPNRRLGNSPLHKAS